VHIIKSRSLGNSRFEKKNPRVWGKIHREGGVYHEQHADNNVERRNDPPDRKGPHLLPQARFTKIRTPTKKNPKKEERERESREGR